NLQKIELNWGYVENISATTTSITFDYVIDLGEDCVNATFDNYGMEYGFYYHTQPNPSENSHLGKVFGFIDDSFWGYCSLEEPKFSQTFIVQNLQPRTTYYFRFYAKPQNKIIYGQTFSVTTK
ncbi:MAG: hypothetical protein RMJ97_08900, partial [Raineya sp.]|nr:hypothetical protein [Raineya sp.]